MPADGNRATATVDSAPTNPTSPRFLSLGDGNALLQVALSPGDSMFAGESAFCYRGYGLAQEVHHLANRGAIRRALGWAIGKQDRVIKWTNKGTAPTFVGLSAPLPGKIVPIDLRQAGTILTKPCTFLCSVSGCQINRHTVRLIPDGPFPVYNLDLHKISGSGMCYVQAGGVAVQKTLQRAEAMVAELGCVMAFSESCKIVAEHNSGVSREPPYPQGLNVRIAGPGTVFLQSSHFGKFSQSLAAERLMNRAGMGDLFKVAAIAVGMLMVLFAIFDV